MNRKILLATVVLLALELLSVALVYPHLPARVPIHWNLRDQVDGWGPRAMLYAFNPCILAFIGALFSVLAWLSPHRYGLEGFESTFNRISICVLLFLVYMHAIMLWAATGRILDMNRTIFLGVCGLIVLLGNVMGKIRRNFFVGFRTPWTLASERVWNATHRFGAFSMVLGGLLAALVTFAEFYSAAIVLLLAGCLLPLLFSLVYAKYLEARGQLDAESDLSNTSHPLGLR